MNFIFDYSILFFGTCLSIVAAFFAFLEKRKENIQDTKSNKANLGAFIVITLGALVTCLGGVHSIKNQQVSDNKAKYLQLHSDSLSLALLVKQNELNINLKSQKDTLKNVLSISQQLNDAQDKIIDLQKDISSQVSGDNSIPLIFAFGHKKPFVPDHYYVDFSISNKNRYPTYGIALGLFDFYELKNNMEGYGDSIKWKLNKNFDLFEIANHYFDFDVLYPNYKKTFYQSDIIIKPDLETNNVTTSYSYTLHLHWGGKYSCNEEIILKPNKDYEFLYLRQIKLETNGKKSVQNYHDTDIIPLHKF